MTGAPEIQMGDRYNESVDTFSFALVLLCLAAGDIEYVVKAARVKSSCDYVNGVRPPFPPDLLKGCPAICALISEMWDDDFRSRPSFKSIVPRLEACTSLAAGVY